jgi:hypothetical protein
VSRAIAGCPIRAIATVGSVRESEMRAAAALFDADLERVAKAIQVQLGLP